MMRPIFYFEKLKPYDKWSIGIYLIISLVLFYFFSFSENNQTKNDIIFGYALSTQLLIYPFCYKSLRNLKVYFIWLLIGIMHLYLYFLLKDDPTLNIPRGNANFQLKNTLLLLIIYQVLRFLSLKIQKQEFVCPERGLKTDILGERKPNWLDITLSFIYFSAVFILD
jgi:hypothetical protein